MRLRPKQGPLSALRDMRLDLLFLFFWAGPLLVAIDDGVLVLGVLLCSFFTLFLVVMQMYFPI